MCDIKPIETEYDGYRFRSRLEARWAVFFNELGIKYEYEPEGFELSDDTRYLPDFYLPELYCYFEVKRKNLIGSERDKAMEKMKKLGSGCIIAFGDPVDDELYLYADGPMGSDSWGMFEGLEVSIGVCEKGTTLLYPADAWYANYRNENVFFSYFGSNDGNNIPNEEYEDDVPELIKEARLTARQARFEHGESPIGKKVSRDSILKELSKQRTQMAKAKALERKLDAERLNKMKYIFSDEGAVELWYRDGGSIITFVSIKKRRLFGRRIGLSAGMNIVNVVVPNVISDQDPHTIRELFMGLGNAHSMSLASSIPVLEDEYKCWARYSTYKEYLENSVDRLSNVEFLCGGGGKLFTDVRFEKRRLIVKFNEAFIDALDLWEDKPTDKECD